MKHALALALFLLPSLTFAGGLVATESAVQTYGPTKSAPGGYPTFGVHNPAQYSPCQTPGCVYHRGENEPSDPLYPPQWQSAWTMYTIHSGSEAHPPPYPKDISKIDGLDYTVSSGATFYDSTFESPAHSGEGAMMEHYVERCLPIFPLNNEFTCSFISLGDVAYFLTYEENRPKDMPECCLFSPLNHAPRRDFIKHLPYSPADSARVKDIQAYSIKTPGPGGAPILFGYAFNSTYSTDTAHNATKTDPYRHPHQFYFSGAPTDPPNAPMVTQIYDNFSSVPPDPAETWARVGEMCSAQPLPKCKLFSR